MWTEKEDTIALAVPCAISIFTFLAGVVVCYFILKSKKKFKVSNIIYNVSRKHVFSCHYRLTIISDYRMHIAVSSL